MLRNERHAAAGYSESDFAERSRHFDNLKESTFQPRLLGPFDLTNSTDAKWWNERRPFAAHRPARGPSSTVTVQDQVTLLPGARERIKRTTNETRDR